MIYETVNLTLWIYRFNVENRVTDLMIFNDSEGF